MGGKQTSRLSDFRYDGPVQTCHINDLIGARDLPMHQGLTLVAPSRFSGPIEEASFGELLEGTAFPALVEIGEVFVSNSVGKHVSPYDDELVGRLLVVLDRNCQPAHAPFDGDDA